MPTTKFTVFTPTYNRGHTLDRVFWSLCDQTFTDFEWLVVDDGSTDQTWERIICYSEAAKFPVRYYWQNNGGKHRAHNRAVHLALGELFVVADSDDWITDYALERMDRLWLAVRDRADCCGVCGLCAGVDGRTIGSRYTDAMTYSTLNERKFKYGMTGEHWGCMRTDLVKAYPFPDIDGFVPEGLVWLAIGKKYKDLCVNEVYRIYDLPDGLCGGADLGSHDLAQQSLSDGL
jgi:glycosyltransferase involved in cell wall biosynthesis